MSQHRRCLCLLRFATSHSLSLSSLSPSIHQHTKQQLHCCPTEIFGAALQTLAGTCLLHGLFKPPHSASEGRLATLFTPQGGELHSALESSKSLWGPMARTSLQQSQGHPSLQGQAHNGFVSLWTARNLPEKEE